jgi:hypothetical protein
MGGLSPQQAVSLYGARNPFSSAAAYSSSNYSAFIDGQLVRLLDWKQPDAQARMAHNAFRSYVSSDGFSCVGAKGALQSGGYRFGYYRGFPSAKSTIEGLARDLAAFVAERPFMAARYKTFVAVFDETRPFGEVEFERRLWTQLETLHEVDRRYFGWDSRVSSDPSDANFAFSVAGEAFFIVGMHPGSSRLSRRFAFPALVFNAHDQFRSLRESGHFHRIQGFVRERELALQGSLNPNLAGYGERSEARQYSGRAVEDDWKCPFRHR